MERYRGDAYNTDVLLQNSFSSRTQRFFTIFSDNEMVVYDTETTGLDTENDDIIQIAAVKISKGKIIDTFEMYIKTDKDVSKSEHVHHISKEYLEKNGVEAKVGILKFMEFCGKDCTLVAHNIIYDYNVLKNNLLRYCNQKLTDYCTKYFDSIEISKLLYPTCTSYKLKDLIEFLKVDGVNSHNALDDVKATVSLIEKLFSDFKTLKQNEYLSNIDNIKVFKKLVNHFNPIYLHIYENIDNYGQLRVVVDKYFISYKPFFAFKPVSREQSLTDEQQWANEMEEVEKLTKHLDFYTNVDYQLTLEQKIHKYIPEYLLFKESDLYLGHEQIVISTVYKAKGLEFDNVVISDATDDMYPRLWVLNKELQRATTQEERHQLQMQITKKSLEDARALYVALTRSKQKLYITHSTQNPLGYTKEQTRFLTCIQDKFTIQQI